MIYSVKVCPCINKIEGWRRGDGDDRSKLLNIPPSLRRARDLSIVLIRSLLRPTKRGASEARSRADPLRELMILGLR